MRCAPKCAVSACQAMSNALWRGASGGCRLLRDFSVVVETREIYLCRHRFGELDEIRVIEVVVDRGHRRERLRRQGDRLASTQRRRRASCNRLAGERVKRSADAAADLDQFLLAATIGDRERQCIKVASAVTEQR